MNAILRYITFVVLILCTVSFSAFAQSDWQYETLDLDPSEYEGLNLAPTDFSNPCVEGSQQVKVNIFGVTKVGIMKLEIYNTEDNFLSKSGRLRSIRNPAQDGPQVMCLDVPEPGFYAIAGYHDKDGNRKLKKKWDFTPREPYGLSKNPKIKSRRIPKWEETSFYIGPSGVEIDIILVDLKARKKDKDEDDKDED